MLILAIIATFIYFTRLQMVAALGDDLDMRTAVFAQIDLFTQVATLVLQLVRSGHLMKRLGVPVTLAILPVVVALGFVGLASSASFAVLVVFQAAFSAVQRAIMRPARETLFTVVSREDKYKSKAFIDTFVYAAATWSARGSRAARAPRAGPRRARVGRRAARRRVGGARHLAGPPPGSDARRRARGRTRRRGRCGAAVARPRAGLKTRSHYTKPKRPI